MLRGRRDWIPVLFAAALPFVALAVSCGEDDPPGAGGSSTDGGSGDGASKNDAAKDGPATAIASGNPFSHGAWAPSLATDGTFVYWIEGGRADAPSGTVKRAKSDGSGAVETLASTQAQPVAIATSVDGVFWTNGGTKEIVALRSGASAPVVLGVASGKPNALTVDPSDVWWAQTAPPAIARIHADPADNGEPYVVAQVTGADRLGQLALFEGDVYFTAPGQASVSKASAGGGGVVVEISGDQPEPTGIVANETAVVWTDRGTEPDFADGVIQRARKDGTVVTLAGDRQNPGFVVADATHAYWLEGEPGGAGRVAKVPIDGGDVTVVAEITKMTSNLALDATHLYWGGGGSIWRAPK